MARETAGPSQRPAHEVIPERIKERRETLGMSKRELGRRMEGMGYELSPSALTLIEKPPNEGGRRVSVEELIALAAVLRVSIDRLYSDEYDSVHSWEEFQVLQMEREIDQLPNRQSDHGIAIRGARKAK